MNSLQRLFEDAEYFCLKLKYNRNDLLLILLLPLLQQLITVTVLLSF